MQSSVKKLHAEPRPSPRTLLQLLESTTVKQGTWQNYLGSNLISYAICRTLQNLAEPLHNYQLGHFDR